MNSELLDDVVAVLQSLLSHLPDAENGEDWDFAWDTLDEESQTEVKISRLLGQTLLNRLVGGAS